jgi:hypothetical protein
MSRICEEEIMKKHIRINIDWGTVLGLAILATAVYLVATAAGERFVRYRAEQRQWRQATTAGTMVQVSQPKRGRPVIGPRLSRED